MSLSANLPEGADFSPASCDCLRPVRRLCAAQFTVRENVADFWSAPEVAVTVMVDVEG